jgi:hypothetical protein
MIANLKGFEDLALGGTKVAGHSEVEDYGVSGSNSVWTLKDKLGVLVAHILFCLFCPLALKRGKRGIEHV